MSSFDIFKLLQPAIIIYGLMVLISAIFDLQHSVLLVRITWALVVVVLPLNYWFRVRKATISEK